MASVKNGMDLSGKVALVIGGTRGIGEAITRSLVGAGAQVMTMSRTGAEGAAGRGGDHPEALTGDVGVKADVDRAVGAVLARHGTIDILVNCAGVIRRKPALDITETDFGFMLDTNLKGVLLSSQAVAPVMRKAGRGRIIHVSSIGAELALMNRSAYCAAKAGVVQLARCLALEWGPFGITVNTIGPGITETPLTRGYLESDPVRRRKMIEKIPLRRLAQPDDMAGAVLFLASDLAGYITGQTLYIDGGWGAGDSDW